MADPKRKLIRATIIYWLLLAYVIAALVWWYISLTGQNRMMRDFQVQRLQSTIDPEKTPVLYQLRLDAINDEFERDRIKFLGEGATFFILLLIGAFFLYRFVRRQFFMQQQQQNFMMAVTHELKTPISVARLNLETMQRYSLAPEKQTKLIRTTLEETARLDFLINNVLIASQLEIGGYRSAREELNLSDLLQDCVNDFRKRYPDRQLVGEIEPDMEVKGDPLLLQILINNLLENALKYSPRDRLVKARLHKATGQIVFEVIDEGVGVAPEEKTKIFSRFYRSGNEATRKTQGTGLGLYLCRKIARDHNADIAVTNNSPQGSIFAVSFRSK